MTEKEDYSGVNSFKELGHKLYKEHGDNALKRTAWKSGEFKMPSFLEGCEKYIKHFQASLEGVRFRLDEIGQIYQRLLPQHLSGEIAEQELGCGTPYKLSLKENTFTIYCATDECEHWDAMNSARLYFIGKGCDVNTFTGQLKKIDEKRYKVIFASFNKPLLGTEIMTYSKPDKSVSDIVLFKLEI